MTLVPPPLTLPLMARKPRVEFEGAVYHVIARGNRRTTVFHDAEDYENYLTRLQRYQDRDRLTCYAYVLMPNHIHLLVETSEIPLSRTMQTLQFTYTQYYNRRYHKSGHLFQGRYHAILCDRDAYLLELVRYLHLNPARMRTPLNPWRYRWSSHGVYLGKSSPVHVSTESVLQLFHNQIGPARDAYRRFLKNGLGQGHRSEYYETVDQRFLGDEQFLEDIEQKAKAKHEISPKGPKISFSQLLPAVASTTGITATRLVQRGKYRDRREARAFLVFVAREWCGLTMKILAKHLNCDPSLISRLYSLYMANRKASWEKRLRALLHI